MTAHRTGALLRAPAFHPSARGELARALLAALPALAAGGVQAQAAAPTAGEPETQTVVVTSGRIEQKLPDALPAITVITRGDIEKSPASDVSGVLREFTSASVAQSGPFGAQTSVFLRGANSNQVLVLIDGAPVSRADFGSAPWELIPLGQIDHIEVVRGNMSSLYGSAAVGGVVQIFTRGGDSSSVSLAAGTHGHVLADASVGRRFGDAATPWDLSAGVSGQSTDGYDATHPSTNPDRDGGNQQGANLHVGKTWAQGQRTDLRYTHSDTASDYDGFAGPVREHLATRLDVVALQTRHDVGAAVNVGVNFGETMFHVDDPTGYSPAGNGHSRVVGADLDWGVADSHDLQLGVEDKEERFADTHTPELARETKSVRVGYIGTFAAAVDVQANLRHDDSQDYGKADTGLVALGWRLSPAWKIVGQFSTAFSAPDFVDMEFAAAPGSLKPTRSHDLEAGVHWTGAGWLARATWFSQRQRDLLVALPSQDYMTVNVGHATNSGVELAADGAAGPGKLALDATFQNPRDDQSGQLTRRPRALASASYRVDLRGWDAGAYLRFVGRHPDGTTSVAPRKTLGLTAEHALGAAWHVGLKIDNVTGTRVPEVVGYTAPPREVLVTLRGDWR